MHLLALILGFLKVAPEIIQEILGVVHHSTQGDNLAIAKAQVAQAQAKK